MTQGLFASPMPSMTNELSPKLMSPDERRAVIARILAQGLLRLRSREVSSDTRLDIPSLQSGGPIDEVPGETL